MPYGQQPGYGGYPLPPRRKPKAGMVFGILIGSMVLIVVVGLLIGQADDGPSASDSPEEVVGQYFDAVADVLNSGDRTDPQATAERLAPYLCADLREDMSEAIEEMGDPDEMTAMYSDEELEVMEGMQFELEYVITDSAVFGDTAIVDVDFTTVVTTEEYGTQSEDSSDSVDLVRESGTWKICDDTSGEFL
ncbi:Rv0361 family membrane protein [Glycomyces arizonensis]|uniref:Rv0361 family membrane protein n=1 Tax=Glycomyces arizonensis TaxID=256035 RepID=UPI0012EBDA17|nr:hypothetical protein [Glycomyces arizonensis]